MCRSCNQRWCQNLVYICAGVRGSVSRGWEHLTQTLIHPAAGTYGRDFCFHPPWHIPSSSLCCWDWQCHSEMTAVTQPLLSLACVPTSISCTCSSLVAYICCRDSSSSLLRSSSVFPSSAARCKSEKQKGQSRCAAVFLLHAQLALHRAALAAGFDADTHLQDIHNLSYSIFDRLQEQRVAELETAYITFLHGTMHCATRIRPTRLG